MTYQNVMSPWAEVDQSDLLGLCPRLETLNGKTIGMFGDFMITATYMLKVTEEEILKKYPEAKFSYFRYMTETTDIAKDKEIAEEFHNWIEGVDCVLAFYGAVPSSSLFLGYCAAYMERLGKPTVMAVVPRTYSAGVRGVKARNVPNLRIIQYVPKVLDIFGRTSLDDMRENMKEDKEAFAAAVMGGLMDPLTEEEKNPTPSKQVYARSTYSGTAEEINALFYENGWTNGTPITVPTKEAVDEMVKGAGYPRDYVVAKIPPMMGCATVEKIAVNAVMAGCLPTYMPVLIAAIEASMDPRIYLEAWCCSQSTWGPVITLSGKVAKDIGYNTADHALTPAFRANSTIARAFGYLMMNIGGVRPGVEDLSEMGHEFRYGFAMGENIDASPWKPLHTDFGFDEEDSAVTMFWPQEHRAFSGSTVEYFLTSLCTVNPYGWDPGACVILTPKCAKLFADHGWTKERIIAYMVEYARRPGSEVDFDWLVGNNHPPKTVDLPVSMSHSTRIFWSDDHIFTLVAGGHAGCMMTVYAGGGDHGGPSCAKLKLPENWQELCEKFSNKKPNYVNY